jgi:hypothetical protein
MRAAACARSDRRSVRTRRAFNIDTTDEIAAFEEMVRPFCLVECEPARDGPRHRAAERASLSANGPSPVLELRDRPGTMCSVPPTEQIDGQHVAVREPRDPSLHEP